MQKGLDLNVLPQPLPLHPYTSPLVPISLLHSCPCQELASSLSSRREDKSLNFYTVSIKGLGWEDPLEKGKATHSSILAYRIPWTESSSLKFSFESILASRHLIKQLVESNL